MFSTGYNNLKILHLYYIWFCTQFMMFLKCIYYDYITKCDFTAVGLINEKNVKKIRENACIYISQF